MDPFRPEEHRPTDAGVGPGIQTVEGAPRSRNSNLNLGIIGNSVVAALIDERARIVWCCFPHLDGDPVFCSLLNVRESPQETGFFDIEVDDFASARQCYRCKSLDLN